MEAMQPKEFKVLGVLTQLSGVAAGFSPVYIKYLKSLIKVNLPPDS